MLTTVEGVYRDRRIELESLPSNVAEDAKAIVIFVDDTTVDLAARGIDRKQKSYTLSSPAILRRKISSICTKSASVSG